MVKHPRRHTWTRVVKVFDYFSGCGGTSKGLENAGMEIVFALDSDIDAIASYRKNFPKAVTHCGDIGKFKIEGVADLVNSSRRVPLLFTACAPCQPFTKLNHFQPESDPRRSLLDSFRDQVEHYMPDYVFLENVPGIQKSKNSDNPVSRLIELLDRMKYRYDAQVVLAQDYGVPQHRRRFILVASKHAPISIPNPTHGTSKDLKPFSTVQDFISELPGIEAGETHTEIPLHKSASLSDLNLQRIKATPEGGSRLDWPDDLVLNCHKNGHRGHTDVYGRMRWNRTSPALTTRCISLSNGRYGHPTQDRAISLLEAALLQTFPEDYIFEGSMVSKARQIGNAVPVKLAEVFGRMFLDHYANTRQDSIAKNV